MTGLEWLGRLLLVVGGITFLLGLVLLVAGRVPLIGRLPGDIVFQRGSFSFYFPLATGILISIVLTIVLNLVFRFFR